MEDLRYPIEQCPLPEVVSKQHFSEYGEQSSSAPAALRAAVAGLNEEQLNTPYRPGGWTVRQVVHHMADSHANGYVRFRMALTEDTPTIKPYDKALWAELSDGKAAPIEPPLELLEALDTRWSLFLDSFADSDWEQPLRHPEVGVLRLDQYFRTYAWHCRQHVAHITRLGEREF